MLANLMEIPPASIGLTKPCKLGIPSTMSPALLPRCGRREPVMKQRRHLSAVQQLVAIWVDRSGDMSVQNQILIANG